jgi:hypothetical protein
LNLDEYLSGLVEDMVGKTNGFVIFGLLTLYLLEDKQSLSVGV